MSDPQSWDALIEIHKQGIVVGTLLGGFTMSSAFQSFSKPWESTIHKYTAIAAFLSSVFFICMVCISALVLFVFSDIEYRIFMEKNVAENGFIITLGLLNLSAGSIGILNLFIMFSLLGWEKSKNLGRLTTSVAILGLVLLLVAFIIVYYKYQLPTYGNLPYLPLL